MRASEILKRLQEMGYIIKRENNRAIRYTGWVLIISDQEYEEAFISGYLRQKSYYVYDRGHQEIAVEQNFRTALRLLYRQVVKERLYI